MDGPIRALSGLTDKVRNGLAEAYRGVRQPGALVREMGRLLGRIHQIDLQVDGRSPELTPLYALADWAVSHGFLEAAEVGPFKTSSFPDPRGTSVCHGDFHPVHCVVQERRIVAVVDWEKAWTGNPSIDLAMSHAYLEFYRPGEAIDRFLEGYAESRPLPDDYEGLSVPVRMAQALGMVRAWHRQGRSAASRRAVSLYRSYLK